MMPEPPGWNNLAAVEVFGPLVAAEAKLSVRKRRDLVYLNAPIISTRRNEQQL